MKTRPRDSKDPYPHRIQKMLSPLAPEQKVKIPIAWAWWAVSTPVAFKTQAYKINSLADTNITYNYLAQYNTFYTKYRVTGATLHFDFCGAQAASATIYAATASPLSTALASAADILRAQGMPNSFGVTVGTVGAPIVSRTLSFAMTNVAGTDEVYTSDTYAAATSAVADPADIIYLHLGMRFLDPGNNTLQSNVSVRGHLDVQYFERSTVSS